MTKQTALLYFFCFIGYTLCYSQNDSTTKGLPDVTALQSKYVDKVDKKITALESSIEKSTLKTLQHLQKQERKLQKKLALKDSVAAKALFAQNKYQQFADKIKNPPVASKLKEYIPQFDSLKTSLAFLDKTKGLTDKLPVGYADKLKSVNTNIAGLEGKMQQAEQLKAYIKERKQLLKAELEKFGMVKQLKSLNKEAYYYTAQINEYKAILKDPKKIEQKALALLNKIPAFTDFMKKNSMLAKLFPVPANYGTPAALAGLQTQSSVQQLLQQRLGIATTISGTANPASIIQPQVEAAQGEMSKWKQKINNFKMGGGGSNTEIPDFKPNNQRTKSFLNRLEYGFNLQTNRNTSLLPSTADVALSLGYKLNDISTTGIGVSFKTGLGKPFNNIRFTSEGLGIRSFAEMKLKGNIWISGGFEMNYLKAFDKLNELYKIDGWQQSGLAGITKKIKAGKKRTANLQLLWDFLSYRQVPAAKPILFRIGYTF